MNENLPPEAYLTLWKLVYVAVASACGSTVAVLMQLINGEKLTKIEIFATYFIGISFAMFFSSMVGSLFNIPGGVSMTLGGSAMMTGMMGMTMAKRLMKMSSKIEGGK